MNIRVDGIRSRVGKELGEILSKDGYVFKKSKSEFVYRNREFTNIYNLLIDSWTNFYSISVRLYISCAAIENIYERILGKSHKLTIGNTIERIFKSPDGRQVVNGNLTIDLTEEKDIDAAIETLYDFYERIAKPYYQRYSTLKDIDDIINNAPFEHCPAHVGGNLDDRCIKGLIVARLVNNPKYEELVLIYNKSIKITMNEKSIEAYDKVRDYLNYNRIL